MNYLVYHERVEFIDKRKFESYFVQVTLDDVVYYGVCTLSELEQLEFATEADFKHIILKNGSWSSHKIDYDYKDKANQE